MENIEIIKNILAKENIGYTTLTQSTSGFTNLVYFVDDKYVIKILAKNRKPEKLEKEIAFYQSAKLDCIPSYVTSGNYEGTLYLIITRLQGDSLYSIWHTLDNHTREDIVIKICDILNEFHKQPHHFLQPKYVTTNWLQKWIDSFKLNIGILRDRGFEVDYLENFAVERLPEIMQEENLCLIYNDAHFDNFLYDGNKLWLIDFDRVQYSSVDYELLIIKSMLDAPHKFASEVDEPNVNPEHYKGIWEVIQNRCKSMFDFKYIDARVFIYKFIYNLGNSYEWNHNDWIEDELVKFKEFFDIK